MSTSLLLQVAAPLVAVLGILLVVRRATSGVDASRILDESAVRRALLDADPGFEPAETVISVDRESALVANAAWTAMGVAFMFGDRLAARVLTPCSIHTVRWDGADSATETVHFFLPDVGCPHLAVRLRGADAARWRPLIDAWCSKRTPHGTGSNVKSP